MLIICTSQYYKENTVHPRPSIYYHYYSFPRWFLKYLSSIWTLPQWPKLFGHLKHACVLLWQTHTHTHTHTHPNNYMLDLHSKYILLEHIMGHKQIIFFLKSILLKENISSIFFSLEQNEGLLHIRPVQHQLSLIKTYLILAVNCGTPMTDPKFSV